jgi:hypothetical protein
VSETIFSDGGTGLTISTYAGPVRSDGGNRRRYQVDVGTSRVTLSAEQWASLGEWFTRDCSPECEGPHLEPTWDRIQVEDT